MSIPNSSSSSEASVIRISELMSRSCRRNVASSTSAAVSFASDAASRRWIIRSWSDKSAMVSHAAYSCHVPGSPGRALASLEIIEERSARLLKLLSYHLQDAGSARLQLRCRLAVDSHACAAQLLGAERDRRPLHGVHEVPERFVLPGRHGGIHLS